MSRRVFVIDEKDNVATVITDELKAGAEVQLEKPENKTVQLQDDISYGHKFAVRKISRGEKIMKYGMPIGKASRDIAQGEHIHTHNVEAIRARGDLVADQVE